MDCWKSGLLLVCAAPWIAAPFSRPQATKDVVTYSRIAPILKVSCVSCHGPDVQMGGLDLSTPEGIKKGGMSGAVVVPRQADRSPLVRRIRGLDGKTQMPMGFKPLDDDKIRAISAWIAGGASLDAEAKGLDHWSYVAPVRPPLPKVSNKDWIRNPIDTFIAARLDQEGWKPSQQASKATLVRRLYLDLIGLPPTIEEMDEFLRDTKPGAYERLVDKLLSSPHFGERQAIGWLDLARYADSNGYEKDDRRTIWPYRDWVIDALNENMPFDEFTIEQIAGDMLPNPTLDDLIATGFHRNTMLNQEGGVDPNEQRWLTLVDRVGTTGTVWLGTTMACAQCHDHKYDPFSIKEFTGMLAFFDNCTEPSISVLDPVTQERVKRLGQRITELEKALPQLKQESDAYKAVANALAQVRAEANTLSTSTTLTLQENAKYPPTTLMRVKGSFLSPGAEVTADTPAFLPPLQGPKNRLGLARWLVSKENPLTARVFVNRLWQQYFGVGLVKTSGDFGSMGERPSHPALLDWLAVEFMESGWDVKHMHRLIVTSSTYRQSSDISAEILAKDPDNRLVSHATRSRLPAEVVRDNALVAAGLLSRKMGGPSVFPDQPAGVWKLPYNGDRWVASEGEDLYRRGVYTFWRRSAPYPAFVNFDAMSREGCTVERVKTNTPLQALTTMNDEAFMRAARGLAEKTMQVPRHLWIETAFRRCVVRRPDSKECQLLEDYYAKQLAHFQANETDARKLVSRPAPFVKDATFAESAACVMLANVLLNLDETITRE